MAKTKKVSTPKTEETITKTKKEYTVEIDINDSHFEAEADSLKDAFVDIVGRPDFPFAPKTRVFIKYGKGDVIKQKIINIIMARRIFSMMAHKESAIEIFTNKLSEYLEE